MYFTRRSFLVSGLLPLTFAFPQMGDTILPIFPFPNWTDNDPSSERRWLSPEYKWFFEHPLPIPPTKPLKFKYINENTGATVDYYEVELKKLQKQIYPNLPSTQLVGYDGLAPGPTFKMTKGREAVVRFINSGASNMSVHVHGQYNRAPFDGWAADYAHPGQYKDYYYPNAQNARTIWYHDHTEFETGQNVYMGQEGFYLLSDAEEKDLNLPDGKFDIPLSICSKQYGQDGQLVYDTYGNNGLPGDVIQVNGQPWPFLAVQPRKYRFRLLNGALSRTFTLSLQDDASGNIIDFNIIASDAGLFSTPVTTPSLSIAMGERYELIMDFTPYANKNLTLHNARGIPGNPDFASTDLVMRFVVGSTVDDHANNGPLPSTLRPMPPIPAANVTKDFTFARVGERWLINGVGWTDIENRILTRPTLGADEIWSLRNGGGNGTGIHPVHIHLVDFQVLSRTGGRGAVAPYEAAGRKDVVWLSPGEQVDVVARYAPWKGVYMFHCHNLVHEDHDMLVAFNVTQLNKWGYDENTTFIDPMAPEFRPKDVNDQDFTEDAILKKLQWFLSLDAYKQPNVTRRHRRWSHSKSPLLL